MLHYVPTSVDYQTTNINNKTVSKKKEWKGKRGRIKGKVAGN